MSSATRIWVLDSDQSVHFMYREIFKTFVVQIFTSIDALKRAFTATSERPDLILSELVGSASNFFSYLDRKFDSTTIPIIAVSHAQDLEAILEDGFCSVVDFIVKPFGPNELKARVKRLISTFEMRQPREREDESLPLRVDVATLSAEFGENYRIDLTMKEFMILSILLNAVEYRMHRGDLIKAIWGTTRVNRKNLDVHLSRLRKKLLPSGCEIKVVAQGCYQLTPSENQHAMAI